MPNETNCGIYRFTDPINNFKIRVKLERLNSNALLPNLQRLRIEEDLARELNVDSKLSSKKLKKEDVAQALDEAKASQFEEVVIGWQQKLFNQREIQDYGQGVGPSSTALDRKYYDEIQNMRASGRDSMRIFTYIEGDLANQAEELDYYLTDSPNEEPSPLALGLNNIRKRRPPQSATGIGYGGQLAKNNIVNQKPNDEDIRANHMGSYGHRTMYIMADLTPKDDRATSELIAGPRYLTECLLCKIRVYGNDTMTIEPDFNAGKTAYLVETGRFSNEVYHYFLEHASSKAQPDDLIKERQLFNEFSLRNQNYLAQLIGNEFSAPPPTTLRLCIFGEIVSAKNFEYDDLYVHYCLDLPENWSAEASMIFSGYTHTATATDTADGDEIVYYSHPFEFEVYYTPRLGSADHELPRMPKIYFQVSSQDGWGRHRTEGYAYIDIPSQPGFYDENLVCWRPRGDSIFNELRAFFIGGSNELEDISYVAIPKQFESEKGKVPLSRFGFRTITTGMLNVRLHVVFQSHTYAIEQRKRYGNQMSRHGFDAFMANITSVIHAFQEAKKRALEIQESTFRLLNPDTGISEAFNE